MHTSFRCGKPEEIRPLGRPRLRWEDNIKMESEEVRIGGRGLNAPGAR
jgi:hypothetical protein